MAPVNKTQIVEQIAANISTDYGIDEAIVNDFKTMMMSSLAEYYVYDADPTKKPKAPKAAKAKEDKGPKKPRKTSSYNVYVKQMMQDPSVKEIPQKEKMSKIGAMWGALNDAQKAVFQGLADAENAANPALVAASDTATQTTA